MPEPLVLVHFLKDFPLVWFTREDLENVRKQYRGARLLTGLGVREGPGAIIPEKFVSKFDRDKNAVYLRSQWKLVADPDHVCLEFRESAGGAHLCLPIQIVESVRIIYTDDALSGGTET